MSLRQGLSLRALVLAVALSVVVVRPGNAFLAASVDVVTESSVFLANVPVPNPGGPQSLTFPNRTVTAKCPSNSVATGGGYRFSDIDAPDVILPLGTFIAASFPVGPTSSGWSVEVQGKNFRFGPPVPRTPKFTVTASTRRP